MNTADDRIRIKTAGRIVVKIGSALLVDSETGLLHSKWLESLAQDIAACRARGQEIIIVSSGAIALGRRYLGFKDGELRLEEKQAAAAAGMVRLTHDYQATLGRYDLTLAQILMTLDDSENRRRYLNARSTIMTLLGVGAVPLINENDTVATDEIRFGDNDRLAARVAAMVSSGFMTPEALELMRPFIEVMEAAVVAQIAAVDEHWGGAEAMFRNGFGFTDDRIADLRGRLLD